MSPNTKRSQRDAGIYGNVPGDYAVKHAGMPIIQDVVRSGPVCRSGRNCPDLMGLNRGNLNKF